MELDTILALAKAGYTKDEIAQMVASNPADPNPTPVQQPAENPVPAAEPAKPEAQTVEPAAVAVPAATPAPQPAQEQPTMAQLMESIAKLTSAVQANAIAQSVIPGGAQQGQPTAEDMLAEIIRPTFKQRGE